MAALLQETLGLGSYEGGLAIRPVPSRSGPSQDEMVKVSRYNRAFSLVKRRETATSPEKEYPGRTAQRAYPRVATFPLWGA